VYSGDAAHLTSTSGVLVQTVNGVPTTTTLASNLDPSTFGQSVTFTATVTSSNGTPTGKVTFKNGAKTLGTVSLVNGVASFSTSTLSVGTPTITAAYGGSTKFATSTGSVVQTVNKAGTTTTITGSSPPSPSTFGQAVTFTGTVTTSAGAGTPTGSVTFMRGTVSVGKATLASGTVKFTTKPTALPAGTDQITAVYAGDTNHAGSTSPVFTQTVNQASTATQVTANPTTITSGQKVTLTATVTATPTSTATGKVVFTDGATNLGSATLSSGTATLVTTGIVGSGTHTITATYNGTTNYLGSSGTVNVTVQ
jgi:large repetitive protein